MSEGLPGDQVQLNRSAWAVIIAVVALIACLCGFVLGSILISASVAYYSGWEGVSVTRLAVTVAFISGPTYTPYPTYTLQPSYTPQPTYTSAPTPVPATQIPQIVVVTPTSAPPGEDKVYTVQEGDTPQSIADQYSLDVVLLIAGNGLDPANPALQVGSEISLSTQAADVCVPANSPVQATVVEVIDGDTIEVLIDGQTNAVHYLGIDAPAMDPVPQPFGSEALSANQRLVDGQAVTLVQDVTQADASGQLPRFVLADDLFVNYELVRQGYADAASTPPDTACDELLTLAAEQARVEGLGMWAAQVTPGGQTLTPTSRPTGTMISTPAPQVWVPPATFTPTSTSSLGFNCICKKGYVAGNFTNQAQAEVCQGICRIAEQRRQAACATAFVGGSASAAGCK